VVKLGSEMTKAELGLRAARDAEVDAKHTYEAAHRRAMLSKDCPKVTRGGTTTAERDAWVEDQCAGEYMQFQVAEVRRQAAKDHLDVTRDQGMLSMALLRSIDTAFNVIVKGQPG
jgi:hypothetical protein